MSQYIAEAEIAERIAELVERCHDRKTLADEVLSLIAEWLWLKRVCEEKLGSYMRDDATRDEILQLVRLRVWKKIETIGYRPGGSSGDYLLTTKSFIRYACLEERQQWKRKPRLVETSVVDLGPDWDVPDRKGDSAVDTESRKIALRLCMQALDERQRILFHARIVEGLTLAATGQRIGLKINGVAKAFAKAKAQVRACVLRKLAEQR